MRCLWEMERLAANHLQPSTSTRLPRTSPLGSLLLRTSPMASPLPTTLFWLSPLNCGLLLARMQVQLTPPPHHIFHSLSPRHLPLHPCPFLLRHCLSTWIPQCLHQCLRNRSIPPSPRPTATPQWSPSSRAWWGTGAAMEGEQPSIDIFNSLCFCYVFPASDLQVHSKMPDPAWEWHISLV